MQQQIRLPKNDKRIYKVFLSTNKFGNSLKVL